MMHAGAIFFHSKPHAPLPKLLACVMAVVMIRGHPVTQQAIRLCIWAAVGHPYGISTLCNFISLIEYRPLALSLLVVRVLDELDDDVLAWLDLQHLEDQAEERGRLDVPTKDSTHMVKVHRLVNQQLGCEETHCM